MVFRVDATVQRGVDAQSADAIVGSNGQLVPAKWKKKAAASTHGQGWSDWFTARPPGVLGGKGGRRGGGISSINIGTDLGDEEAVAKTDNEWRAGPEHAHDLGEDSRGCVKYSTDTVQKAEHRTTRAAARRARDWYSNRGSIHGEPRRPRVGGARTRCGQGCSPPSTQCGHPLQRSLRLRRHRARGAHTRHDPR